MDAPVIRMERIARSFPGPPVVDALRNATFTVYRAEHVAIQGPSGSGKSTLLNLVGLLDTPSSGIYELNGQQVAGLKDSQRTALRRDLIGFVFQDFFLMPGRTALENTALGLVYAGVPPKQRTKRAAEALRMVGLGHRLDALPGTMSGGERQRVAIARALIGEPLLLLCDEPTGNLDSKTAAQVMELISGLDQVSVVTITHDEFTASCAERRLLIRDGVVTEQARHG
jgi:putative ABC transport system ATP-binding protein